MARIEDTLKLGPWNMGVRYDLPSEDISPKGFRQMENVRLSAAAAAEKVLGTTSYAGASAIAAAPTLTACGEYRIPGGDAVVFAIAGTKLYLYSSGWVDKTGSVTITAADDNTWEWVRAFNYMVALNGVDTDAIKWDGSGNATALDDNARFTKGKHIGFWDNRLWIGNVNGATDRVYYSAIGNIESWSATDFLNLGSPITGMAPVGTRLAIHTEDAIHTVSPTGNATYPYELNQRTSTDQNNPQRGGTISGRALVSVPGVGQLFVLDDGIYQWQGGDQISKVSTALDLGYWDSLNNARLGQSFAIYYAGKQEVWFFLPFGSSQTNMNHIMVMSTRHKYVDPDSNQERFAWYGPYTGTTTTFDRNCAAIIDNKPHAGNFGGKLLDHAPVNIFSHEDTAYTAYFETGAPPPYGGDVSLVWLYARCYYDALGSYSLAVRQESQGVGSNAGTLNTTGGGEVLGSFVLDTSSLGTVRMVSKDVELRGYDPHSSLKFTNSNKDEPFRVRHTHLQYGVIGRQRKPTAGIT